MDDDVNLAAIACGIVLLLLLVGWWCLVRPDEARRSPHGVCNTSLYECSR